MNIVKRIAFQPPSPPSYDESDRIIYIECKRSKKKHNIPRNNSSKEISKFETRKVKIPSILFKNKL